MAADFLKQGIPQANTPIAGAGGAFANVIYRFLEALWKRCGQSGSSDIVFSMGVLPTNATKGFLFMPCCAGAPTGVPDQTYDDQVPVVLDKTNGVLYYYPAGGPWTAL